MKTKLLGHSRVLGMIVLVATVAMVAGCGSAANKSANTATGSTTAKSAALDPAAAALLPASVKSAGVVIDGVSAAYAPWEYYSKSHQIAGLDLDLANALARVLGVRLQADNAGFASLIPGVQSGRYDVSMSALTDTAEREKQVSFVNYVTVGDALLVHAGNPHNLTLSTLCGVKVAVTSASSEALVTVPLLNKRCAAAGKPALDVLLVPEASDPVVALTSGRALGAIVDTVSALTIAKASAAGLSVATGPSVNNAPIGIVVAKGNGSLIAALKRATDFIIANGTYSKILAKWGIEQIAVPRAMVNGATG